MKIDKKEKCRSWLAKWIGVLWVATAVEGCDAGYDRLPSGLEYRFVTQRDSIRPAEGEYLMMDLRVITADDSVLFSTQQFGTLFPFRYDTYKMQIGLDNPLEEGFHLMSLGDSVHFRMPADKLYRSSFSVQLPDSLDSQQPVSVYARAVDIYDYESYRRWRAEQAQARSNQLRATQNGLRMEEKAAIEGLLEGEGQDYQFTDSGIGYYLVNPGKGSTPEMNDTVRFTYEVRYQDNTRLPGDLGSSAGEGNSIVLGTQQVLPCWEEIIALLSEGGKGRFYFPSYCAASVSGTRGLRPNEILIVDLQLISIRKG